MLRNPIVISHSKFCKNWPNFAFQSICSFFVLLSITFNNTLAGLELFSRLTRPREDRPMIPPFLSASAPLLSQTHWPCWKDENRGSFLPTQKGTHLKQSMGLRQLWSIEIPKSLPWVEKWAHHHERLTCALWLKILGLGLWTWAGKKLLLFWCVELSGPTSANPSWNWCHWDQDTQLLFTFGPCKVLKI